MRLPSFQKLAKAGAVTGVLAIGSLYLFKSSVRKRMSSSACVKEAIEALEKHEKAINYLGKPITTGFLQIRSISRSYGSFSVPVKGSNTSGWLHCDFVMQMEPEPKSKLVKLKVQFKDIPDKSFVLMNELKQ